MKEGAHFARFSHSTAKAIPPSSKRKAKRNAKSITENSFAYISIKMGRRAKRPLPYDETPVYAGNKIFAQNQLLKLLLPSFLLEEKNGACFSLKKKQAIQKRGGNRPFCLIYRCNFYIRSSRLRNKVLCPSSQKASCRTSGIFPSSAYPSLKNHIRDIFRNGNKGFSSCRKP